ncbi:hypothetical protein RB195_018379 [Necator americanus]|uniref:Transmembrane protein n=1 Tax=Necator americanus TaxID=51031 RepID=A0ABR1C9I6_NECAM
MLLYLKFVPLRAVLCRRVPSFASARTFADKISDAYNRSVQTKGQAVKEAPTGYMTKAKFEAQMKSQRVQSSDADHGEIPTKWQRFCLVLTRLYQRKSDIPEYVASGTMNRMHDRMRVVFITVGVCCFFVLFFYAESQTASKIARDRDAGVSLTHKNSPLFPSFDGGGGDDDSSSFFGQIEQFNTTFGCYSMSYFEKF